MFKKYAFVLLLASSLTFSGFAQDFAPEATPESTEAAQPVVVVEDGAALGTISDPTPIEQEASDTISENALFLAFAAPLVLMLTSLLKRLPFLLSTPSSRIALVLNIVIWVAYVIAKEFGVGDQFETITGSVTTVLGALTGVIFTGIGAGALHSQAAKNQIPVIGYTRPTPPL